MPAKKEIIHFLHIGKTGGTALVHALNQHNYCIQSPRRTKSSPYVLNQPEPDSPFWICVHPHNESLRMVPEGERFFFFLRDPISKFISAFYSRQRHGRPKYNSPWNPKEEIAYAHFTVPNQLANAIYSSNDETRTIAQQSMRGIQHIKSSYWDWFENEKYLKSRMQDVLFIGLQEYLSEEMDLLRAKLDLPHRLTLPDDETLAHKNPSTLDKTLDETALANLRRWYSKDYEFIDLCQSLFDTTIMPHHLRSEAGHTGASASAS